MPTATKSRAACKLLVMLLLPVVFYSIPTNGIFNGETTCLFSRFLDIECWGCGITRAFFSLLYGKYIQAWEYNPLIVPLFPLLIWMWGKEVWKAIKELKQL